MRLGIMGLGAVLFAAGVVLTILEAQQSPLPFLNVLLSGRDYIVLIVGLVLMIVGLCLDLFLKRPDKT